MQQNFSGIIESSPLISDYMNHKWIIRAEKFGKIKNFQKISQICATNCVENVKHMEPRIYWKQQQVFIIYNRYFMVALSLSFSSLFYLYTVYKRNSPIISRVFFFFWKTHKQNVAYAVAAILRKISLYHNFHFIHIFSAT